MQPGESGFDQRRRRFARRCFGAAVGLIAAVAALSGAPLAAAAEHDAAAHEHGSDLLLFPAVTGFTGTSAVPSAIRGSVRPEVDFFYSTDRGRLRFLAEFLTRASEREMERFQLGWLVSAEARLWLGRFHSPLGMWNSDHHHGAFMQTSILRPSIAAFEDEGGVLPTHVSGALLEGAEEMGRGSLTYAAGIGRGPTYGDELEPVKFSVPGRGGRQAAALRVGYQVASTVDSEAGLFAAHTLIPVRGDAALSEVAQSVAGAFFEASSERARVIAEAFHVSNLLTGPAASRRTSFGAAYLQGEYAARPALTLYGRLEGTRHHRGDAYLDLFPEFVSARAMLGTRFALARHQALKLEVSRSERQDDRRFNLLGIQWSMVYP